MLEVFSQQLRASPRITGDEIETHDRPTIVLPREMTLPRAHEIIGQKIEESKQVTAFTRIFKYRPDDGAHAAAIVLKRRYGITVGRPVPQMFGPPKPPEYRTIAIGPGKTTEVPWGRIEIPSLPGAQIDLAAASSEDGVVFAAQAQCPKMHKGEIEQLFDAIDAELRTNSIYRGHALVGASKLEFLDTSKFDPTKIVFSSEVTDVLSNALMGPLMHADAMKRNGLGLKRSILLYGDYGTGKSSIGLWTAQVAERHGWTFLMAKPGRDSITDVMRTARLYQRAVVFVEDIDGAGGVGDSTKVSELLENFDGITAKGAEVIMVLTTNHIERVHKGMLRPGRLDYTVEVGPLDQTGVTRLIQVVCGENLEDDIDYDSIYAEMDAFLPAFVKEAIDRAKTWAVNRTNGDTTWKLSTADLVSAARSLRQQLDLLRGAGEGRPTPVLDVALTELVRSSTEGVRVLDEDGDLAYQLAKPATK
jgi:transitional endoplasmic reticulum ATPase